MEAILQTAKDLLKFKVISSINTGDKTFDNILTAFLMSIIVFLLSDTMWKSLYLKIKIYFYRDLRDKDIAEYYSKKLSTCQDYKLDDKDTIIKVVHYMRQNCNQLCDFSNASVNAGCMIIKHNTLTYILINTNIATIITLVYTHILQNSDIICPLLLTRYGAVGIKRFISKVTDAYELRLTFESQKALQIFQDCIKEINITPNNLTNTADVDQKKCFIEITETHGIAKYEIFPDRTFDTIVSKYKTPLLKHISNFQNSNKGKSAFNGFGSYNFGMLIYGEPGTGKTSFIKAICNLLGRNGVIYDMREMKTNEQFKNIFRSRVNEVVYIFEEFDCVQGVLSRELSQNENCTKDDDIRKELKEKYFRLLELQPAECKESKNITKELEGVRKELAELQQRLNLETMLTCLDGPIEMRNRVIIGTTNYIDRIDRALLRPGRFDLKIKLETF